MIHLVRRVVKDKDIEIHRHGGWNGGSLGLGGGRSRASVSSGYGAPLRGGLAVDGGGNCTTV